MKLEIHIVAEEKKKIQIHIVYCYNYILKRNLIYKISLSDSQHYISQNLIIIYL